MMRRLRRSGPAATRYDRPANGMFNREVLTIRRGAPIVVKIHYADD